MEGFEPSGDMTYTTSVIYARPAKKQPAPVVVEMAVNGDCFCVITINRVFGQQPGAIVRLLFLHVT